MPQLHHSRGSPPPFPATGGTSLSDDVTQLHVARRSRAPSRIPSNTSIASLAGVKADDADGKKEHVAEVKAKFRNGASKLKDKINGDVSHNDDDPDGTKDAEDVAEPVASVKEIPAGDPTARRTFFADTGKRKEIFFGPEVRRPCALYTSIADWYDRISSQATSVMAISPSPQVSL